MFDFSQLTIEDKIILSIASTSICLWSSISCSYGIYVDNGRKIDSDVFLNPLTILAFPVGLLSLFAFIVSLIDYFTFFS